MSFNTVTDTQIVLPGFVQLDSALRRLIDSNVLAVTISEPNGKIHYVNDAIVQLFGYTVEDQAAGLSWHELIPAECRKNEPAVMEELSQFGYAKPWESQIIAKDGRTVPVLIGITLISSSPVLLLCYLIDLTELKISKKIDQERQARFSLLAEAIADIVWIADSQWRSTYCNNRFYETTGLSAEDDDGSAWRGIVHPDDMPKILAQCRKAAEEGTNFEEEARYRTASGVYRWHLIRAVPMKDAQGKPYEWFGTSTDIDDKKHHEEELRESIARFHILADAIPQMVWIADCEGKINFVNHRWLEYTGLTGEQIIAGGWRLLIHPDDVDKYTSEWEKVLQTGDTFEMEFRIKRAVGLTKGARNSYRWHLGRAVSVRGSAGNILEWFGTWTEIEDQKRK